MAETQGKQQGKKSIARNRSARHEYEIGETFECGLRFRRVKSSTTSVRLQPSAILTVRFSELSRSAAARSASLPYASVPSQGGWRSEHVELLAKIFSCEFYENHSYFRNNVLESLKVCYYLHERLTADKGHG